MRALALGLTLLSCALVSADQVVLQHTRPSKLLTIITSNLLNRKTEGVPSGQGLIPAGIVNVRADDVAGTILFDGPAEAATEFKQILSQFDVAPKQINLRITIQSPADKYESTTTTDINNNAEWTLRDGTTGVQLTVVPRINGDGSVTGGFSVGSDLEGTKMVTRSKDKEVLHLKLSSNGSALFLPTAGRDGIKGTEILVTVKFVIKEDPSQGPIRPSSNH